MLYDFILFYFLHSVIFLRQNFGIYLLMASGHEKIYF